MNNEARVTTPIAETQPNKGPLLDRRQFLRGAAAVGLGVTAAAMLPEGALFPQTVRGQAEAAAPTTEGDAATETEQAEYEAKIREAIAAQIMAARADERPFADNTPVTYKQLLTPITHWEEVNTALQYYADTFMLKRSERTGLPTNEEVAQQVGYLGSEYVMKMALIVDRVLNKWNDQNQMSTTNETGHSGLDWDKNISPLRRMVLLILDMQSGKTPRLDDDKIFTISYNEDGSVKETVDTGETFNDRIFKVLQYIMLMPPSDLAGYIRDADPGDPNNPTYLPRMAISETQTFDTDGVIGNTNKFVFDATALQKYTKATAEHNKLTTEKAKEQGLTIKQRIYNFLSGNRTLVAQQQAERRLSTAEQFKIDLGSMVLH